MKDHNRLNNCILYVLAALFMCACNVFSFNSNSRGQPVKEERTPTPDMDLLKLELPADFYFLDDYQIWRFNHVDETLEKISKETRRIDSFDFSPASGMLVYIIDNQLILTDKDGKDRQVLRAGPSIPEISDDFLLERLNDPNHISGAIRTPHWSQDGRRVAFIENGLKIIDLETNQVETLVENRVTFGRELVIEKILSWSPDSHRFLISLYAIPLERLVERDITLFSEGDDFIGFPSANYEYNCGKLTFAWSPGSSRYYIADACFGGLRSLIRCDIDDYCALIGEERPAHTYYFHAHPFVINDEELMVFIGSSGDDVTQPERFRLYWMTYQGYGFRELRKDAYVPESALWSPNGDGVLITLAQPTGEFETGSVLWLRVEDEPAILLPIKNPENLRWGSSP